MTPNELPRRSDPITVEQAYIAMFLFLDAFYEQGRRGPSTEGVRNVLSWANPFSGDKDPDPEVVATADPAFWYDWLASVKQPHPQPAGSTRDFRGFQGLVRTSHSADLDSHVRIHHDVARENVVAR
jgi:hypothetical protein